MGWLWNMNRTQGTLGAWESRERKPGDRTRGTLAESRWDLRLERTVDEKAMTSGKETREESNLKLPSIHAPHIPWRKRAGTLLYIFSCLFCIFSFFCFSISLLIRASSNGVSLSYDCLLSVSRSCFSVNHPHQPNPQSLDISFAFSQLSQSRSGYRYRIGRRLLQTGPVRISN